MEEDDVLDRHFEFDITYFSVENIKKVIKYFIRIIYILFKSIPRLKFLSPTCIAINYAIKITILIAIIIAIKMFIFLIYVFVSIALFIAINSVIKIVIKVAMENFDKVQV